MSELKSKTIYGLFWTVGQQFGVQLVNFSVSILLARILLPEEFGLIGIVYIFIAIGKTLVEGGLGDSLIRTENPDDTDYSSVFFTNLVFALSTYFIIFLLAPAISHFFENPLLIDLIRVFCLMFIINALSIVQSSKLNKEMNFKLQLMINLPALIASGILGVVLATSGFGVWSIVWMNLFRATVATAQLWLWGKWTPTFIFDKERILHHIKFGYKVSVSKLITTGGKNLNNIIIAKLFMPEVLGFYIRAKTMQELPISNITNALKKVSFPMLASIQDDEVRTRSIFLRIIQQVFFFVTPVMFVLIVVAEPLFSFLLTDKWLPAVPYFQVLCFGGIFTTLSYFYLNILLVKGHSNKYLKLETIQNILLLLAAGLIFPFGIIGLLWGVVIVNVIMISIYAYFSGRVIGLNLREQIYSLLPIFVASLLVGLLSFFLNQYLEQYLFSDWFQVLIISVFAFIGYAILSYVLKVEAMFELVKLYQNRSAN